MSRLKRRPRRTGCRGSQTNRRPQAQRRSASQRGGLGSLLRDPAGRWRVFWLGVKQRTAAALRRRSVRAARVDRLSGLPAGAPDPA